MRYPKDHKRQTRARILDQAATRFRDSGYTGVGIDALMQAAGLTRGAFYAHFSSKANLFAEVLRLRPTLAQWLRDERGEHERAPARATQRVIRGYLSSDHLDRVGELCSMATLTVDTARAGEEAQAAYTQGVVDLVDELKHHTPKRGAAAERSALVAVALMVGGVTIARALNDEALAKRLLAACQSQVLAVLGE